MCMSSRAHLAALITAASLLLLPGCTIDDAATNSSPADTSTEEAAEVEEFEEVSVTIRSVGDILIHNEVYFDAANRAAAAGKEGYDFTPMLAPVKKYLENADITTANMEVPVAGEEHTLAGYPTFNSPPEIIDALKDSGVDIVNNATNHTMDRSTAGVEASTSNMRERDMLYVGGYSSAEDRATPRIIESNGLKVGFLAYTYGTNGIPVPEGDEWAVNLIDPELMRADIAALRPDVDVLIVMMHAGEEYQTLPNKYQVDNANVAREAGADFILGGHPHVLEPFDRYPEDEPGLGVWWSHGNFLHGQYDEQTKFGGIGEYTITRHTDGSLSLDTIRFMPTYTVGRPYTPEFSVIPLAEAGELGYVDVEATGELGYVDVEAKRQQVSDVLNTYTSVEVVDYLD